MLDINEVVRFTPTSRDILGEKIEGKILSKLPFNKAMLFSTIDLATVHQLVYDNIGEISVPDIQTVTFIEIETFPNKEIKYIAIPWIAQDTIEILTQIPSAVITITGTYDLETIKSFLRFKGIDYTIS